MLMVIGEGGTGPAPVETLADLMLSKESEDLTRYYAAEALLNRGWGRPATAITGEGDTGRGEGRADGRERVLPVTVCSRLTR